MANVITIQNDEYEPMRVNRDAYIKAKTRDLQEFGYSDITEDIVSEQLDAAINGEELSVIGMFIKRDLYVKENNDG